MPSRAERPGLRCWQKRIKVSSARRTDRGAGRHRPLPNRAVHESGSLSLGGRLALEADTEAAATVAIGYQQRSDGHDRSLETNLDGVHDVADVDLGDGAGGVGRQEQRLGRQPPAALRAISWPDRTATTRVA
jgi:hypothetical protein